VAGKSVAVREIRDEEAGSLAFVLPLLRHWQVLNVVRSGADITDELRPFWTAGAITQEEVIADLAARGWLTGDGPYQLTPDGEVAYAGIADQVHRSRAAITRGVSEDEYATAVRTLRRMVENLEP